MTRRPPSRLRHGLIALSLAGLGLTALAACEQGKTRHPPPDLMAVAPPTGPVAPPTEGLSAGLARRDEPAGFFLDHVGQAVDPRGHPPAATPADQVMVLDGFGFDPVAKVPAKGVDVVMDGKVYGTTYGAPRPDVAGFFKTPELANVGFKTTLPAGTVPVGVHTVTVRVIAADGKGYFDSPPVPFTAN